MTSSLDRFYPFGFGTCDGEHVPSWAPSPGDVLSISRADTGLGGYQPLDPPFPLIVYQVSSYPDHMGVRVQGARTDNFNPRDPDLLIVFLEENDFVVSGQMDIFPPGCNNNRDGFILPPGVR